MIAEKDLELRGPGDFFGTRQWGMPTLRVSNLIRDRGLLERAREEAWRHASSAPSLEALEGDLRRAGWEHRFGLAQVG